MEGVHHTSPCPSAARSEGSNKGVGGWILNSKSQCPRRAGELHVTKRPHRPIHVGGACAANVLYHGSYSLAIS